VIDDDTVERELLARARSGLSPSRADEERVKSAVVHRIALLPFAGADETASGELDGRFDEVVGFAKPWLVRLGIIAAVAAGGGAGYFFGHRAGVEEGRAAVANAPREDAPPRRTLAAEPVAVAPPTRVPASAAPLLELPRPVASGHVSAPAPSSDPTGLDEEVRLLRRVERALRDQNPRYAFALLGELDRTVPGGQLVEERQAARAMARCELEGGGDAVVKKFAESHPGSAYLTRVVETCRRAEQRIFGEAETHQKSGERK
jgi:hypothetical protein